MSPCSNNQLLLGDAEGSWRATRLVREVDEAALGLSRLALMEHHPLHHCLEGSWPMRRAHSRYTSNVVSMCPCPRTTRWCFIRPRSAGYKNFLSFTKCFAEKARSHWWKRCLTSMCVNISLLSQDYDSSIHHFLVLSKHTWMKHQSWGTALPNKSGTSHQSTSVKSHETLSCKVAFQMISRPVTVSNMAEEHNLYIICI